MDTTTDLLASQPFLAGLGPISLPRLAAQAARVSFHTNDVIFTEGPAAGRSG
jgi:hypothetical protein